ncbi:ABC transporter substrate-binding protein [Arthrobacter sunyaminii]|uniref:ABC transporter substrate-binding protein n=1 Tax=Arthrobacter sunyaminii TaxID=2816859 RepID=A0A975S5G1_9MICC|nr:ABC transporter substrate-binding protein [Arthrobacter sunyaminii]MBO0908949.1 ABC transporter substrate-binding protein [Arthrobacter sunyaminii]QWQ35549.1 ABC transporter substrate-binding protein [Arthrobacter sunyaminii]
MFTSRKRLAGVAALAATALLVTSCQSGGGAGEESASGGGDAILTMPGASSTQFTENFNPFSTTALLGVQSTVYETLFFVNRAAEGDPVPVLGTEYSYNDEGNVLTINTREGVSWSDGEPFTANDVVFTLNLIANTPALNTGGFDGVAEAVSDTELTITYPKPDVLNSIGALSSIYIVPEHIWSEVEDPATFINQDAVGTGPFVVSDFSPQSYLLEKNEEYWEAGKPELDGVRYVSLSGNQAGVDSILNGDVDWMSMFIPEVDTLLGPEEDVEYVNTVQNQLSLVTCSNVELGCTGPQTDPAVRQAIYAAMDRDQLNSLAFSNLNGDVSPTYALLPRDEKWISPSIEEPVASNKGDAAKAEKLLTDAGFAKGADGIYAKDGERLSFSVKTVTGWTDWIAGIETMAQQLLPVGIELKAEQMSWNEWTEATNTGNFQMLVNNLWPGAGSEPYYLYKAFFDSESTAPVGESANPNWARYSNPDVDAALDVLNGTTDESLKMEQYAIIQEAIAEDMPYIPIQSYGSLSTFRTDVVTGWPSDDDLYALPMVWQAPDYGQVLKNLTLK